MAILESTGASFTALTVNVKFLTSVNVPSVSVKDRFETPFVSGKEVKVAVQFGAVPLNTIPESGSKVKLDEVAVTDALQAKLSSTSVIVKLTASGKSSEVV